MSLLIWALPTVSLHEGLTNFVRADCMEGMWTQTFEGMPQNLSNPVSC